jgi:unsaturated rhamnogalacturonyl hydrolase
LILRSHFVQSFLLIAVTGLVMGQPDSPAKAGQPPALRDVRAATPFPSASAISAAAPQPDSALYLPQISNANTGPLWLVAQRGAAALQGQCDWAAGTLAYGWIHAWRVTQAEQYLLWARDWIDGCIPLTPTITQVNDGLLGYAALVVYEQYGQSARLDFAQTVADYLMSTAPRTADGTLIHLGGTVWDDTLLGVVPFLLEMGRVTGNATYTEEAYTQVIDHAHHLQDLATGLYHHAWDENQNNYSGPVYWGRGNGWAMLADIEALSAMTATHPLSATVLSIFQRQAAALRPLQDSSGLWHTVVTRSDFYTETSASALIGFAFQVGAEVGWLDSADYAPAGRAASAGVWGQVLPDGTVANVSSPTGPMANDTDYNAIPHDQLQLYGQGLTLLLDKPFGP